jgi:hypothetical protein
MTYLSIFLKIGPDLKMSIDRVAKLKDQISNFPIKLEINSPVIID